MFSMVKKGTEKIIKNEKNIKKDLKIEFNKNLN